MVIGKGQSKMRSAWCIVAVAVSLTAPIKADEVPGETWEAPDIPESVLEKVLEKGLGLIYTHVVHTTEEELTDDQILLKDTVLTDLTEAQAVFGKTLVALRMAICEGKTDRNAEWTALKIARNSYYEAWNRAKNELLILDDLASAKAALGITREHVIRQLPKRHVVPNEAVQNGAECQSVRVFLPNHASIH